VYEIAQSVYPRHRILYGGHVVVCNNFSPFIQSTLNLLNDILDCVSIPLNAAFVDMATNKNNFIDAERQAFSRLLGMNGLDLCFRQLADCNAGNALPFQNCYKVLPDEVFSIWIKRH